MSKNEKLILEALKDGEKRWKDLERFLVKSGKMSKATLSRNLLNLERNGRIKRHVDYSKKPSIAWYMLAYFEPRLERKIREVVEELRREFKFFKEPTAKEVAVRVGETPETVRSMLFGLAPKIEWREQNEEEAEKEAKQSIHLAGWLKWLEKREEEKFQEISRMVEVEETERMAEMNVLQVRLIFRGKIEEINRIAEEEAGKASNHVLIMAKRILKEFPTLIPDVKPTPPGAAINEWPEETKRAWSRVFGTEPPTPTRQVDDGKVIAAIKRLWSILLRPPTVEEIAVETGVPLDSSEKLAYESAKRTGWFNPTPKLVEDTAEKFGEVLVCAARIRDGKVKEDGRSEDFDYDGELETVEEAKRFLKEHPEMLPKLSEDGEDVISWPSEALKYLGKIYKPKDRGIPRGFVVPR